MENLKIRRIPVQTTADSLIAVENLSHSYQTRQALNKVSFNVSCGEIFGSSRTER